MTIWTFCLMIWVSGYRWPIARSNSGITRIFLSSVWKLNLRSSNLRAPKNIFNDIKLEPVPRELNIENPLLNFCVGVWVGEHPLLTKSDSQGIGHNFWYPWNQHDLLNHFQFLAIKKSPRGKSFADFLSRNLSYL